jgi:hypothetical protein
MTIKQRIKLNMFLSVRTITGKFTDVIKKILKYEASFAIFMGYVDEIQAVSEQQSINKTGMTQDKNKLKAKLISNTIKYSNKLSYLAKSTDNDTLLKEVQLRKSELAQLSGVALRDRAQLVYDRMAANLALLEDQGVTAETQKQFAELITTFNQAISFPRAGIIERSQATTKLALLYAQAENALSMLDMIVESARDEQPDFYTAYKNARKIVDLNLGKIALRGVAIDFASKEPIKGVFFRFRPKELKAGSLQEITKKTADKGRFNVKNILPGSYQVLVSKQGYREKDTSLTIQEGETKEIMVELEKE